MKTYKDIYVFPLRKDSELDWVYDEAGNFVFQFEPKYNKEGYRSGYLSFVEKSLKVLNGEKVERTTDYTFFHESERIYYMIPETTERVHIITIRGWGNLTGIGAHNLPAEEAANIQDTFAEFIVDKLNER